MAVGAAAQNRGVAGLEAEAARIRGDVGTAFEDDADHAERHAHALDDEPIGAGPARPNPGNRAGEGPPLFPPFSDPLPRPFPPPPAPEHGPGPAPPRPLDSLAPLL